MGSDTEVHLPGVRDAPAEVYRSIVNRSHDGFLVVDGAGVILWASDAAGRFFGGSPDKLVGQSFGRPREVARPELEIEIITPDGTYGAGELAVTAIDWQGIPGNLIVVRDVSLSSTITQNLAHASQFDTQTGLLTQRAFKERVRQARDRALRFGGGFAVIMVVPNQVPTVNASLGYDQGEELILRIAQRLCECLDSADALGRVDHQTFAYVIEDVRSGEHAHARAEAIAAAFADPLPVDDRLLAVTLSIGLVFSDGREGPDADLLSAAQAAVLAEGSHTRTNIATVSDTSTQSLRQQFEFGEELRAAVTRGQLLLAYQPIVKADDELVAVEALVRWQRSRELLLPGRFLGIAESIGVSAEIDLEVLRQACDQASHWTEHRDLTVHVNISGHDLVEEGFVAEAVEIVRAAAVDPSRICFELTETALIDTHAMATLDALRTLGCRFAIDDFGTGFSSYTLLEQLSLDVLKIDRSFVGGLGRSHKDGLIVNSMITLARGLGLTAIAEGVETEAQARMLRSLQCDAIQGYLIAKPMPADRLTHLLATRWDARRS